MRAPHRSPDLLGIDNASLSVASAPCPRAPASQSSFLTSDLRLSGVWPNVLLIGPVPRVEAAVSTIVGASRTPVCYWTLNVPLSTVGAERTVVIREIATWCTDLQRAWLTWLSERSPRPQIISTSSLDIFPLVTEGWFLEDLYYRLNTVLLYVGRSEEQMA
jgi:hypothetical protein